MSALAQFATSPIAEYAKTRFGKSAPLVPLGAHSQERGGYTIEQLREFINEHCDPSAPEPEWRKTVRMVHFETGGSPEGLDLADEWSAKGSNYTGREAIESRWNSPSWNDPNTASITMATLLRERKIDVLGMLGPQSLLQTVPPAPEEKRIELTLRPLRLDLKTCYIPPREFPLYPLFTRGIVTLLSSAGGLGKSHVVIYIAICMALGIPPFEGTECKKPCRIVIATAEDDYEEVERRAQKIIAAMECHGIRVDMQLLHDNLKIIDMTGLGASVLLTKIERSATVSTRLAEKIIKAIVAADLIVFDTQSRFNGGSENDNSSMAVFMSECETVAKQTDACVLVITHTGKAAARDGTGDGYMPRGASSGPDNSRGGIGLIPLTKEQLEAFEIDEERVERGEVFQLVHPKNSYGPKLYDGVFLERLPDGVILPFKPTPKERDSEDELLAKLLAYVGTGQIYRNHLKSPAIYREIFGPEVANQKTAWAVFDRATREGYLVASGPELNNRQNFKVSPKGLNDKRHGMSIVVNNDDLIGELPPAAEVQS